MTGGAKKWMPELKLEAAVPGPTENWMPDPTLDGVAHARAVKWIPERKLDAAEEFLARGARLAVSGEAAVSGLFATHRPRAVCWGNEMTLQTAATASERCRRPPLPVIASFTATSCARNRWLVFGPLPKRTIEEYLNTIPDTVTYRVANRPTA